MAGRIVEVGAVALQVCGGLAVRDHDDLPGPRLVLGEQLPRQQEGVVHVRSRDPVVPRYLGKLILLQLNGVVGEPNNVELVPGKLGANEGCQGHRHLLGRLEAAVKPHGAALVQEQHSGGLGHVLRAMYLEVRRRQLDGNAAAVSKQGVSDRPLQVNIEVVAELIGLGLARVVSPCAS